jgi:hypothetical protein
MKTINELIHGECTVVTDHGNFHGSYNSQLKCIFFAIPSNYQIIGYIQ